MRQSKRGPIIEAPPQTSHRQVAKSVNNGSAMVGDHQMLRTALDYGTAGLRVLPLHSIRKSHCTCGNTCPSPGKHPITSHGLDDATTDPDVITSWWRRSPWANIGVRPPDGTVVLDIDPRNHGDLNLRALIREHEALPETLTARTGGGGWHLWLAYRGPLRGHLCEGVDLKGHRGYVVMPPSLHRSGQRYRWATVAPTAPAPRWLRPLLTPAPSRTATIGAQMPADGLVRVVAHANAGNRNSALYWAAMRAAERGDVAVLDALYGAALDAGLSEAETTRTITSAMRRAAA